MEFFLSPDIVGDFQNVPSTPIGIARGSVDPYKEMERLEKELRRLNGGGKRGNNIKRGMFTGDISSILNQLDMSRNELSRAITSTMTAFPVRENLEAPARILVPLDTPVRNKLPRTMGSGKASAWKQLVSLGGGWAGATVTAGNLTGGSTVIIPVVSVAGLFVGDTITIDVGTAQETRIISAVTPGTPSVTVSVAVTNSHTAPVAVVKYGVNPGSGTGVGGIQAFFAESGAPAAHQSVYADASAAYKLLGIFDSITGFAMASGSSFQNQLSREKTNSIMNLMLNEENALINGISTSVIPPWGDGTNALAFDGLRTLISTGNGTPTAQIQTAVGALTTAHLDAQLGRLFNQGAKGIYMVMNPQECISLAHLAEAAGSIIRVMATSDGKAVLGVTVTGYIDTITGQEIPIYPSRFLNPGNILFMAERLPDGSPACDVQVLPQVQLPQLAPNENIQGYVAQEIAPSQTAPNVFPWMVSVFETLRLISALHFAQSTGVTAV